MADFNTAPAERTKVSIPYTADGYDYTYSNFSYEPGQVGQWKQVGGDDYNAPSWQFQPSKFDFSGATLGAGNRGFANRPSGDYSWQDLRTYTMPDGSQVEYDPWSDNVTQFNLPMSAYENSANIGTDVYGRTYAYPNLPSEFANFQNQGLVNYSYDPYLYDPNTKKVIVNANGTPKVAQLTKDGGFDSWITENGWMIPLAMAAAGAGAAAGGAAAGSTAGGAGIETAGAGGLAGGGGFVPAAGSGASFAIDPLATYGAVGAGEIGGATVAELAGPTYGELGVTGLPEGAAGPTYGEMGYTGLNQSAAINAADAASAISSAAANTSIPIGDQLGDYPMPGEDGTASQWTPSNINPQDVTNLLDYNASLSQGTSLFDALKTANQVKQGVNTANTLAKLLSGTSTATKTASTTGGTTGTTSNANLSALASLLNPSAQTNSYIGQIKANENPFTFTSAGQTSASPGMYDVSGSNLANALRKA